MCKNKMLIRCLFSRKWVVATLLAALSVGVMVRLGIWQLDRLEQRRAFNMRVVEQIEQQPVALTNDNLSQDFSEMEYRTIIVRGQYDFSNEVALRNQVWNERIGVHLLTPLIISGTNTAIVVDRGWIPQDAYLSGNWSDFPEPGNVEVMGIIRVAQTQPDFGRMSDPAVAPGMWVNSWNLANIEQISRQIPYPVLSFYIQQSPDEDWTAMPYRSNLIPEISEGSHMSYAIQWFTFASIVVVGYPIYVKREQNKSAMEGKNESHKVEK